MLDMAYSMLDSGDGRGLPNIQYRISQSDDTPKILVLSLGVHGTIATRNPVPCARYSRLGIVMLHAERTYNFV